MIPYIYNWETYFSLKNTQADGMSSNFFSAVVAAENLPDLAAPMNVLAPAPMDVVLAAAPMDVIRSDSDAAQPPPKSRGGRPSGSLNHSTIEKNRQAAVIESARSKKETAAIKRIQAQVEIEEERRAKEGPPLRSYSYLGPKVCAPMGKVPGRLNRALSSDDIRHAISSITVLKKRGVESVFSLV